jgi:hypothetical protein
LHCSQSLLSSYAQPLMFSTFQSLMLLSAF